MYKNFRQFLNRTWNVLTIAYQDFQHMEYFFEIVSILATSQILCTVNDYNPIAFLSVPYIFMINKKLRDKISSNAKLSAFLEPLMISWMFTSMIFVSIFSFSKVLGLDSIFQSILSFLVLYIFISVVIYQKKGLNPIFFGTKQMNKIHD